MTSPVRTFFFVCFAFSLSLFADSEVGRHGITWEFAGEVVSGTFANGDPWVVGPVQVLSVSPQTTINGNGEALHGSMLNPQRGATQGFDSRIRYNAYDPLLNIELDLPAEISPGSVMVSSISYPELSTLTGPHDPQLQHLAVLTILSEPPASNAFRPPVFGSDRSPRWTTDTLDLDILRSLPLVPGSPADLEGLIQNFEYYWNEQNSSWTGRYIHAGGNQPGYGREIAHKYGAALVALHLDYPDAQKRELLIHLVQNGLDIYGVANAGGEWPDLGGHCHGRKLPLLLAGEMLRDAAIKIYGDAGEHFIFQEDRQTWHVAGSDVGRPLYQGDGRPREEYLPEDVGIPEWGEQHVRQPQRDGRNWNAYYRHNVGSSILGHILSARLLGLENDWNWPALFEYGDRFWEIEKDNPRGGANNIQEMVWRVWDATGGGLEPSGVYFVDPTLGDDVNGNGGPENPLKTLQKALSVVKAGETILLENGNYGRVVLENLHYADYVTIRSRNTLGAELEDVTVDNCAYVRFDDIRATAGRESIFITGGSHHIEVLNSEVYGRSQYDRQNPEYTQVTQLYGIQVGNAADVVIENVYAHDIKNAGFYFNSVEGLVVRGCNADWVASDGYKFAGVHNALIENNTGMVNVHSSPDAHRDFMQKQGPGVGMSNSTFRGNWAIMTTAGFQGIFSSAATNSNILLENNIIYCGMARAISVYGDNISARYNTVINPTDGNGDYIGTKAAQIFGATTSQNNVAATYLAASGISDGNHVLQYEDAGRSFHYDDYYVAVSKPVGTVTIEDFRPVSGSPADGRVGAFERILEVLGHTTTPRAEAPAITPNGGLFGGAVSVALASGTPDAEIHYTLDGATPTKNDPLYVDVLSINNTATLNAVAFKTDFRPSLMSWATFTVDVTGPHISRINALGDGRSLQVVFDEEPSPSHAETIENYLISDGIDVAAASLDGHTVTLGTSQMTDGATYTLTVDTMSDALGNVSRNSTRGFTYEKVDLDTGLQAHWRLDETSGTVAADASGNGHDGTVGGAVWTGGRVGGALRFDGDDDRVDLPAFNLSGNAFTLSLWMNLVSQGVSDARLFSKADGTAENDHILMLSTINDRALRFRLKTEGNSTVTLIGPSSSFSFDTWHHVAVIYDGADLRILIDGEENSSMGVSGDIAQSSDAIALGDQPPGAGTRPLDGMLDQVRLYDRILTSEEITRLRNETAFANWIHGYDPSLTGDDALPGADPDGNGIPHLFEYALDFESPTSGATLSPRPSTQLKGAELWGYYHWRRNKRSTDLLYSVEYSYNLSTPWTPVDPAHADFSEAVQDEDVDADGSAALMQTGAKIPTEGNLFFRLRVDQP